jgi:hypothetical protein
VKAKSKKRAIPRHRRQVPASSARQERAIEKAERQKARREIARENRAGGYVDEMQALWHKAADEALAKQGLRLPEPGEHPSGWYHSFVVPGWNEEEGGHFKAWVTDLPRPSEREREESFDLYMAEERRKREEGRNRSNGGTGTSTGKQWWYVAAGFSYVLVRATDERAAAKLGRPKLRALLGREPSEIREVRPATPEELEMMEHHVRMTRQTRSMRGANRAHAPALPPFVRVVQTRDVPSDGSAGVVVRSQHKSYRAAMTAARKLVMDPCSPVGSGEFVVIHEPGTARTHERWLAAWVSL